MDTSTQTYSRRHRIRTGKTDVEIELAVLILITHKRISLIDKCVLVAAADKVDGCNEQCCKLFHSVMWLISVNILIYSFSSL